MTREYEFVFYNFGQDYQAPIANGLRKLEGVHVYSKAFSFRSSQEEALFTMHWSNQINRRIQLPLKSLWYPKLYGSPKRKPCCFVFYEGKYLREDLRFVDYIKQQNADNKTIIYFSDSVSKKKIPNLEDIMKKADLVLSYDKEECARYGMKYIEDIYYEQLLEPTEPEEFKYDVLFLGYAKDRLKFIYDVYHMMERYHLKMRFIIAGVEKKDRIRADSIEYIEQPISYMDYLELVQQTRCILEVVQKDSCATTKRLLESVCYKRKLLSNAPSLTKSSLYSPENMMQFDKVEEIPLEFLQDPINYETLGQVRTETSASFLEYIADALQD